MGFWYNEKTEVPRLSRMILIPIIVIAAVSIVFGTFITIPAGHRGVVLEFGKVTDRILNEGFYTVTPFVNSVQTMDVRTQKYEAEASAASKDLQDTSTKVALNYHLNPARVNELYQTIGVEYQDTILKPAIQEVVKASTAQFGAKELITDRQSVKDKIDSALESRLEPRGIIVETVSITDFTFSPQFTQAIEDTVKSQQLVIKAENDLKIIQIEAQQEKARGLGVSQAIELIQAQLAKSPQYVQYLATQKWDGKLPAVTGGVVPFLNIPMPTNTTVG